jgi:alpha 1,3-glucosidase
MKAHRAGSTVGVFLVTGSETWIDIEKQSTSKTVSSAFKMASRSTTTLDKGPTATTASTHWMAESGILDLFVFLGPTSSDIFQQYTALTGKIPMPQLFAIAYHQCRWNYQSEDDVLGVQSKFDEADIPLDVIWLDIEYAEGTLREEQVQPHCCLPLCSFCRAQIFYLGSKKFPYAGKDARTARCSGSQGKAFYVSLVALFFWSTYAETLLVQLVAIVDPHIKRTQDLYIYKEAQDLDILCKTPDGKEFEGWCWTGSSAWTDWFNPKSWDWWIKQFAFEKFKVGWSFGIWNDENQEADI